ncbi:MAG: YybH family protein [bacterium]
MSQILKFFVILLFVISLFSCQSLETSLTENEKAEIKDKIKQLSNQLVETWNNKEYERYMNCYLNSDQFTFAANGKITRSWSTFSERVKASADIYTKAEVNIDEQYIDIIDRNVAIVSETFDWTATDTSGKEEKMHGTYTTVYIKRGGEWKVIYVAESFPGEF